MRVTLELPPPGPTLRIFGALLWAYIVFGEWVAGMEFPEPLAVLLVTTAFVATWVTSVARDALPWHRFTPGLAALGLWVLLLIMSPAQPGAAARSELVSALFCLIAAGSYYLGCRCEPRPARAVTASARRRALAIQILAGSVTLVAIVSGLQRI